MELLVRAFPMGTHLNYKDFPEHSYQTINTANGSPVLALAYQNETW